MTCTQIFNRKVILISIHYNFSIYNDQTEIEVRVDYKKLSTKWRNLKYRAKQKASQFKAKQKKTGGEHNV